MFMRMASNASLRVGILGASGFTGAELLRIAARHRNMSVGVVAAASQAGSAVAEVHPQLAAAYRDQRFSVVDPEAVDGYDLVFLGLPHEASLELVPELLGNVGCVVDLSAAYRLRDAAAYPAYYGFDHTQADVLASAVYGLPEFHRADLNGATLVATPGCYVTAAIIALRPLVIAGLVEREGMIVDAASGVTGAGRREELAYSFTTVDENLTAYGLMSHRHTPEMEQEIGGRVLFTPHLAPMNRGILATCYSRPVDGSAISTEVVLATLRAQYADEPFVVVTDGIPGTKATMGSNMVLVTGRYDPRTRTIITIAALDNLAKGASGGAVQAANVALGLAETEGLDMVGVAP